MENVKEVEDQAAAWLIKRDAGDWNDADQQSLDEWLESSTANMVAFLRLETAWRRTHRLKSLGAGIPLGVVPSPEDWQLSPLFEPPKQTSALRAHPKGGKFPLRRWTLAAGLFMAIAASVWLMRPAGTAYHTPVGGFATVPTSDGSTIILNTDSQIRVDIGKTERRVSLEHGEAFFQVARDAYRPFVVTAGSKRVIAVGTAFSVYRNQDDFRVVVTEGKVRIERDDSEEMLLPAGSIARGFRDAVRLEKKPVARMEEELSWRSGFLTFRETTLGEAIEEFNRYNDRKIIIADREIAAIRFSGRFQATQYEAFVRLLEDSFPVRAQADEKVIRLSAR